MISNRYYVDYNIDILTNNIARLYLETISSLGSRIIVKGKKNFLQDCKVQEKIRCLLFSGIRSIVLYKQFNKNHLKLMYFRRDIIKKAQHILYVLNNQT